MNDINDTKNDIMRNIINKKGSHYCERYRAALHKPDGLFIEGIVH